MNNRISGFGLLEIVFALAILMSVSPFVYNQMNQRTKEIQDINLAKQLIRFFLKNQCITSFNKFFFKKMQNLLDSGEKILYSIF